MSISICLYLSNHSFFLSITGFTCLVWQKLEEQNPSFFYVYNIMLRLKDQIVSYNYLVIFFLSFSFLYSLLFIFKIQTVCISNLQMEKQNEIKRRVLNAAPKTEDNSKLNVDISKIFSSPLELSSMDTE